TVASERAYHSAWRTERSPGVGAQLTHERRETMTQKSEQGGTPAASQAAFDYQPTAEESELIRLSGEWMEAAMGSKDEKRLRQLVDAEGRVDYAALRSDGSALARARELETCDLEALQGRAEKLAFWINAYNALVLAGVLRALRERPEMRGLADGGGLGLLRFFYLQRYCVGRRRLSLATI